jgi:anaerobic magnesium-protoporphyrin IX monomethyl ester cyclase
MTQKPKLLLCVPNYRWAVSDKRTLWHIIPYNLCLLAAVIRPKFDVEIVDAHTKDLSPETFTQQIHRHQPDVVGITVSMDQFAASGHKAAGCVKTISANIAVIMGGVYATVNPEMAVADPNVDFVVIGEGEFVLDQLLDYLFKKGPLPEKGICYRQNGKIVERGCSDRIRDLDALPLPAYDLIDYPAYGRTVDRKSVDSPSKLPYARIMTSRGCPHGCVFCQVEMISGRNFRARSPEHIISEIAWLKERYHIASLIFDDDNLFADRKRAKQLFQMMIDHDLAMPWKSIATAVFRLDEELIGLMRSSGCEYICIAIESGSPRVLREIIKKPVKYDHARRMVQIAQRHGIYVSANFIIGFPTETWTEIRQTLAFAEALEADYVKIFNAIPLKHTRLWDLCLEHNAFKTSFDWNDINWNRGQIATDEFSADDLTILRAFEWDRINFNTPQKCLKTADWMHVSVEELKKIRKDTLQGAIAVVRRGASPSSGHLPE